MKLFTTHSLTRTGRGVVRARRLHPPVPTSLFLIRVLAVEQATQPVQCRLEARLAPRGIPPDRFQTLLLFLVDFLLFCLEPGQLAQ